MASPNCYQRGNFVCWVSSLSGKKNIRECVRGYQVNNLTCQAARQRFCAVHGTRMCSNNIRVCDTDECPADGVYNKPIMPEVYLNDEGQNLDMLIDQLSGRDTNFVMGGEGGGITASRLPDIGEGGEKRGGGFLSFDNKIFLPALVLLLGVGVIVFTANKGKFKFKGFKPWRR